MVRRIDCFSQHHQLFLDARNSEGNSIRSSRVKGFIQVGLFLQKCGSAEVVIGCGKHIESVKCLSYCC